MSHSDPSNRARADLDAWREQLAHDRYDRDPFFVRLLRRHLGRDHANLDSRFREVANTTGAAFAGWVAESGRDEALPVVCRHDPDGRAVERVVFHPAYHEVGRVFWGSGVLAILERPGSWVVSGGLAYLLGQHGEAGHACPVACTAGAIKLLQRLGTADQQARFLPSLLDPDYARRIHAAQFVTEVQGGSDVGANACVAKPDDERKGHYRIHGEKWFCSVADAGLFVVSARLEGGAPGTRGLGLFLVPRTIDGAPNGFELRRLKTKLGTRAMATGEIEFRGARAEAIGPIEQGFKNLVGIVLDTSRVHNALAACALMRGAFDVAQGYARNRRAFGRPILEFPSTASILARMRLRTAAGLVSTFRILALTDRAETGGPDEQRTDARRMAVMINKYRTSLAATQNARDGIEILGGNGTIEDFSPLPRLYRDAIVIESWEGTHNTLCAQILRDITTREQHQSWLLTIEDEIEALTRDELSAAARRARELHRDVSTRIDRLLASDDVTAAAHIRTVVDWMGRLTDHVGLSTQAQWDLEHGGPGHALDLVELFCATELDAQDPQQAPQLIELERRIAAHEG